MEKEKCVICGVDTGIDVTTHIDFRIGYVEGAGQLCKECYLNGGPPSREQILIPKHWINKYPNNYELGEKIRQYYWSEYENKND